MCSQTILFRSAFQYEFAVQVPDQTSLTPSSHDLTLIFEWREKVPSSHTDSV